MMAPLFALFRCLLVASISLPMILSMPASKEPHEYRLPDGTLSPPIQLHGDEHYHWYSDMDGYTLVQNGGWFEYAKADPDDPNELVTTGALVGQANPEILGLQEQELPMAVASGEMFSDHERRLDVTIPEGIMCDFHGTEENPCKLTTLVVLIRFADHEDRVLPSREAFEDLFNTAGPTENSPTGSVRDALLENSYGKYELDAHVTDWIQVSRNESETAGDNFGQGFQAWDTWYEALSTMEADGFDFSVYDRDSSGKIDMIALIHSGTGAERGGDDCEKPEGTGDNTNRVWSHRWSFNQDFFEADGVKAGAFYVSNGVWGLCPPDGAGFPWEIGRVGVLLHETAHVLGLPDLYDTNGGGHGQSTHELMADSWGWSGDQLYPPHLGAWSKYKLQWSEVVHVTQPTTVTIGPSCSDPRVFLITHGLENEEYFLLENRHSCGLDVEYGMPNNPGATREGIALWHIDESDILSDVNYWSEGVCESGSCPLHYEVALVQADGNWNLERGEKFKYGDQFDLFKRGDAFPNTAFRIDDDGITMNNGTTFAEPSTQSYATGTMVPSGISIEVITEGAADFTTVRIVLDGADPPPTMSPTAPPSRAPTPPPSKAPTPPPSKAPTSPPTLLPTKTPTPQPSPQPTKAPTPQPTKAPTLPPTMAPTPQPINSAPSGTVPITFYILFDAWPVDYGFNIFGVTDSDVLYEAVPTGTWGSGFGGGESTTFTVNLPKNKEYTFEFLDSWGDGMHTGGIQGYYALYYGSADAVGDNSKLLFEDRDFAGSIGRRSTRFWSIDPNNVAGPSPTSTPTLVPTKNPTASPTSSSGVEVTFFIQFDEWPVDYGFQVTPASDFDTVLYSVETGTWAGSANRGKTLSLTFSLPASETPLSLHFFDSYGDGLGVVSDGNPLGYYALYLGTSATLDDSSKLLVVDREFIGSISSRVTDFSTADPTLATESSPGLEGRDNNKSQETVAPSLAPISSPQLLTNKNCGSDKCGVCEGHCKGKDKNCKDGLICFERNGLESVPGCGGNGESNKDYCIDPVEALSFGDETAAEWWLL